MIIYNPPPMSTSADFAFAFYFPSEVTTLTGFVVEYAIAHASDHSNVVTVSSAAADPRLTLDTVNKIVTIRFPAGTLQPGRYFHEGRIREVATGLITPLFDGWPVITQGAF